MAAAAKPASAPLPFIHPDHMPDRYALTGRGACMSPLIPDGTLLVFDKREEPQPGDVVGITFTPEAARQWNLPGLVKRLVMALPTSPTGGLSGLIVVEQLNPPRQYCIPSWDVLAVHKAVGTAIRDDEGRAMFCPTKVEAWS